MDGKRPHDGAGGDPGMGSSLGVSVRMRQAGGGRVDPQGGHGQEQGPVIDAVQPAVMQEDPGHQPGDHFTPNAGGFLQPGHGSPDQVAEQGGEHADQQRPNPNQPGSHHINPLE